MTKILDLSINNFYSKRNNNELLPNSIRACIIGKSGCGKTILLMNLLLQDYLDYKNLYIFSKSLHQPLYQILIEGLENRLSKQEILNCILKQKFTIEPKTNNNPIKVSYFDNADAIPDPNKIDLNLKTIRSKNLHKNPTIYIESYLLTLKYGYMNGIDSRYSNLLFNDDRLKEDKLWV
jgi:predicted ATP-binding protein involved in virulence